MNALLDEYTDAQVAAILNERGLRSGASEAFAAVILAALATSRERPDRAPPYAPVPDISHAAATGA